MEYFEDLRNINHCEFIIMKQNPETGKYVLENQLRTWSELKKQKAKEQESEKRQEAATHDVEQGKAKSPPPKTRIWGGCPEGCNHEHDDYPKRPRASITRDFSGFTPGSTVTSPKAAKSAVEPIVVMAPNLPTLMQVVEEESEAFPHPGQRDHASNGASSTEDHTMALAERRKHLPTYLEAGRDFGGSDSGASSPQDGHHGADYAFTHEKGDAKAAQEEQWVTESGMGSLAMADALGDQFDEADQHDQGTADLDEQEAEDKSLRGSVY